MGQTDVARSLRHALRANAVFSLTTGLLALLASSAVASWMGAFQTLEILILGGQLLLFAAWLFWLSRRGSIPQWQVILVLVLDVGWVVGSALLILSAPASLTVAGKWAIIGVADLVGLFALFQLIGLVRLRNGLRRMTENQARPVSAA